MICRLCNACVSEYVFDVKLFDGKYYCSTHKIYFRFIGNNSNDIFFKYKNYYIEILENVIYIEDVNMEVNKFKLKIPKMDNNLFLESIEGIILLS